MNINTLWEFPVPSTALASSGVRLIDGEGIWLLFDYFDIYQVDNEGRSPVYNSGIWFSLTQAYRHVSEMFINLELMDAYDSLIEVTDSWWLRELADINKEIAEKFPLRHFAILLDSNGLFEFAACDYKILKTQEGPLGAQTRKVFDIRLISPAWLPKGFAYPKQFVQMLEDGLVSLDPWCFLPKAREELRILQRIHPSRKLVPFAQKGYGGPLACFDVCQPGKVHIIQPSSPPGKEQIASYDDYLHWLKAATEDMVEFVRLKDR